MTPNCARQRTALAVAELEVSPRALGVAAANVRTALLTITLFSVSCAAPAGRRLTYYLALPAERGDVFAQGALDGVDYRTLLREAIEKNPAALSGIFRYTASGHLMGEGAETNSEILLQLLRTWGDAAYARVLAAESLNVRAAVIAELDYSWPYPGWHPKDFPATFRLAKHNTSYRQ